MKQGGSVGADILAGITCHSHCALQVLGLQEGAPLSDYSKNKQQPDTGDHWSGKGLIIKPVCNVTTTFKAGVLFFARVRAWEGGGSPLHRGSVSFQYGSRTLTHSMTAGPCSREWPGSQVNSTMVPML